MEGLFYFVCILFILCIWVLIVRFYYIQEKLSKEDNLRKETMKNALCDICGCLESIRNILSETE